MPSPYVQPKYGVWHQPWLEQAQVIVHTRVDTDNLISTQVQGHLFTQQATYWVLQVITIAAYIYTAPLHAQPTLQVRQLSTELQRLTQGHVAGICRAGFEQRFG